MGGSMGPGVDRWPTGQAEVEIEQNRSACRALKGTGEVGWASLRPLLLVLVTWDWGPFV